MKKRYIGLTVLALVFIAILLIVITPTPTPTGLSHLIEAKENIEKNSDCFKVVLNGEEKTICKMGSVTVNAGDANRVTAELSK